MTETLLTLYHGTTISRAQEIMRTRKLSAHAETLMQVRDELKTTPGYVYLTQSPALAAYYGNMLAIVHHEAQFCIYKVTVKAERLEVNYDNLRILNTLRNIEIKSPAEALRLTQSCRVAADLHLGTEVTHAAYFPSNMSEERTQVVRELLALRRPEKLSKAITLAQQLPWTTLLAQTHSSDK